MTPEQSLTIDKLARLVWWYELRYAGAANVPPELRKTRELACDLATALMGEDEEEG